VDTRAESAAIAANFAALFTMAWNHCPRSMEYAIHDQRAKRMVKKQQTRWTPCGAHLLLQIRAKVLNAISPAHSDGGTRGFSGTEDVKVAA